MSYRFPAAVLFLAFCITLSDLMAQTVEVQWGAMIKESRHSEVLDVVGSDTTGYYVVKGPRSDNPDGVKNNYYTGEYLKESVNTGIVHLDQDMKPVKETIIEGEELKLDHLATFKVRDRVYTFSSHLDQKKHFRRVYVQTIDRSGLLLGQDLQQVAEIEDTRTVLDSEVDFAFSRDSSFILVYTNVQGRKKDPDRFAMHVFDAKMTPLWSKDVAVPIRENRFQVADLVLDDFGNVYIVAKHYHSQPKDKVKGKPGYEYVVYGYRNQGQEKVDYILNLRNHFLSDLHLEVAPNGELICAGFFSDYGVSTAKGTFYLTVDPSTREILQKSLYEFGIDFLTMHLSDGKKARIQKKAANGKDVGLGKFDIRELISRPDGGSILVAEQYFVREIGTGYGYNSDPVQFKYHYNDIVVVSIDPVGDIEWATKIPKRQVSLDDGGYYSSFAMMMRKGNLHFIYNDHKLNIEEQRTSNLKNFKLDDDNGIIALATVDPLGKVERKPLFPNSDLLTICRPKMCSQVNEHEMLIYGRTGNKTQFGKITFN